MQFVTGNIISGNRDAEHKDLSVHIQIYQYTYRFLNVWVFVQTVTKMLKKFESYKFLGKKEKINKYFQVEGV